LDVHHLKPARLDVLPGQPDVVCADDGQLEGQGWLEYPFSKSHPIIRWLPEASKLAAWIGKNFGQELQIPPQLDVEWTAEELNAILENNLVPSHGGKGQLRTGHSFRRRNRQVLMISHMISYLSNIYYDIIYDIR
jgi:hypothetical protein